MVRYGTGEEVFDKKYNDLYGKERATDYTHTTFMITDVYCGNTSLIIMKLL